MLFTIIHSDFLCTKRASSLDLWEEKELFNILLNIAPSELSNVFCPETNWTQSSCWSLHHYYWSRVGTDDQWIFHKNLISKIGQSALWTGAYLLQNIQHGKERVLNFINHVFLIKLCQYSCISDLQCTKV